MNEQEARCLDYTVEHFKNIARENRFPENATVSHDADSCLICHPEKTSLPPFFVYLQVAAESVKVRRPQLDERLVEAINDDLALLGRDPCVTLQALLSENERAAGAWRQATTSRGVPDAAVSTRPTTAAGAWRGWIVDAINTGLALLSIHSPTSLEFSLDEPGVPEAGALIQATVADIMRYQMRNRTDGGRGSSSGPGGGLDQG